MRMQRCLQTGAWLIALMALGCGGGRSANAPPLTQPPPEGPPPQMPPPPPDTPTAQQASTAPQRPLAMPEPRPELPPPGPQPIDRGSAPQPGQPSPPSPFAGPPLRPDSKAKLAPAEGLEWGINRNGFDYAWFRVVDDPQACRIACENDPSCTAFTYVKPGVRDVHAVCQLKSQLPTPSHDDCCVSGVKGRWR